MITTIRQVSRHHRSVIEKEVCNSEAQYHNDFHSEFALRYQKYHEVQFCILQSDFRPHLVVANQSSASQHDLCIGH